MKYSIPEKEGIKSSYIKEFVKSLEDARLITHNLIIMRNDKIIFENYWEPFHKDFLHRMYSVTKSFVSLAVGFACQDSLVSLDDPIVKYFPEETKKLTDENVKKQTIRDMLMMSTAKTEWSWFLHRPEDRVKHYFDNPNNSRVPGAVFDYDSTGSFVLGAMVERVTGMELLEYLRKKFLDRIGFSKESFILKCPGGHSWSDSALICKPTDLLKTAMFCMNLGKWDGEQILNEEYIKNATKKQIDNNLNGIYDYDTQGYGYKFWMTYDNSYFFNGMGCQLAVCVPDKDIIMIYNGDNQSRVDGEKIIIDNFFDKIVRKAEEIELDDTGYEDLIVYAKELKLYSAVGKSDSVIKEKINNVTYILDKNPMNITRIKFSFNGSGGTLYFTNEQGDKEIPFGMCCNEFSYFPQYGYSDTIGTKQGNRLYKCATSGAWVSEHQLFIKCQIIDTYFGTLNINVGFKEDKIGIYMKKTAEDFLKEYEGFATGIIQKSN